MPKTKEHSHPLIVELQAPNIVEGTAFDILAPGEFVDMYGREFVITEGDLKEMAQNTRAIIESSRTEGGELVGLPIDYGMHDKGEAAGWIKEVFFENGVLRARADFNEDGQEAIEKDRLRMFSGTFDMIQNQVLGGTLTNWPAVRAETGDYLLRPIEMSEGHQNQMFSLHAPDAPGWFKRFIGEFSNQFRAPEQEPDGGNDMAENITLEDLTDEQREQLAAEFAEQNGGAAGELPEGWAEMAEEYGTIENFYQARLSADLEKQREANRVAEFSRRVVEGGEGLTHGLPVDAESLEGLLMELSKPQRDQVMSILENVQKNGLVDFSERGEEGEETPDSSKMELAPEIHADLTRHVEGGGTVSEYFEAAGSILGDMEDYDLSEFEVEEDK